MKLREMSAIVVFSCCASSALFSEPALEEESLAAAQSLSLDLALLSGGLRYRLATPAGEPGMTESDAAAGFGLFVRSGSNAGDSGFFFYKANAALVSLPVAQRHVQDTQNNLQTLFYLLPGDNLYGGLRVFSRPDLEAHIVLGRSRAKDFDDALLGGHGSQTTLSFQLKHRSYGWLSIEPLLFPALRGHFFRDTDQYRPLFVPPTETMERLRAAGNADRSSYGHRLSLKTGVAPLFLGVQYTLLRVESPPAEPGERRKSPTHLELASVGLGLERLPGIWGARFFLGLEQSRGQYASALAGEEQRYRSSIHGAALRSGLAMLYGPFVFRLHFFLPEPPSPRRGSAERQREKTGYVGYGDHAITGALLGEGLAMQPYPELCLRTCTGIELRRETFRLARAAAVLRGGLAYEGEGLRIRLGATFVEPLAVRPPGGSNAFQKLRRDPRADSFREFDLDLIWFLPGEGALAVSYGRAYRIQKAIFQEQRRRQILLGESLQFRLQIRAFGAAW
ncbi:MAG: hypothetical protein KDK35_12275 [Leptospiraceae bacterium]|nr:hypothetical protein [Leptospiraceae bacterium]